MSGRCKGRRGLGGGVEGEAILGAHLSRWHRSSQVYSRCNCRSVMRSRACRDPTTTSQHRPLRPVRSVGERDPPFRWGRGE
uniref:Uncharacterized protein n=1 Tax=Arundo donax TaxID=35708 RepID=A0A0A9FUK3_ARUDO